MASFFDDFNEKKKKKKTTVQTVTPVKAVKAKQETKQATKTKTVSQSSKALVNKNKSFVKGYENKKKVSLPTVSKPSLPKQTMNGSLRTPVRAMGETKKRATQNTAVETRRRNQQTLSAADKKLSPVQQRAVQTYKADWDAAKARGDRAGMNLAHQRAEDIRWKQGYSGGVAGNEYISPKISRQDRDLLNQSGQLAMKQAKLDYDRASATGNTMGMKEAILEMTALRKEEKYRSMGFRPYDGMDAHGRTREGGAMTRSDMAAAEKRFQEGLYSTMATVPGSILSFFETTDQAIDNNTVEKNRAYLQDKANRLTEYQTKLDMVRSGQGLPEWGSASWLEQQVRIAQNAKNLLEQKTIVDQNLPGQTLMRKASQAGTAALEGLEGADRDLAQALMSVGQNLPSAALSAIPVVGPAIGAGLMGLQASGARAWELNEQTAMANHLARVQGGDPRDYGAVTPAEASFRGLLSGLVEAGTEKIGLDRLGKLLTGQGGRNVVKNILAQMGIEGTEESIAYTANYVLDEIAKDPNAEWSPEELWDSFRLGAIAGGMMAGPAQLIGNARNAQPQEENARRAFNVRNPGESVESGLVRDDYTSRQDQKTMDEIDEISKRLGLTVQFADQVAGGAANASIRGNVVTIERNNRNPVRFLYGHEVAHFMQEASPDAYTNFRAVIANEKEVSDRVEEIMAEGGMNWDQALDEVTADYAGTLIENERILQRFIQENQKNKPLLQRLADAFRGLLQKITGKDKAKVQNAVEALELAMHETIKGNRLRTGREARIETRRAKQTQRWQENRREDLIQRLIQDYPTMEGEMKAQVDNLGIEGVVDAYLNGGNNPVLAAYEEAQTRYSFKRAGDTRQAEEMEAQGETRETIWQATGQTRDTKGNWVEEVDDSKAKFYPLGDAKRQGNPDWVRLKELESKMLDGSITQEELEEANALAQNLRGMPKGSTLGDYLDHPELFQAVPGIEDTPFRMEDMEGVRGEHSKRGIAVNRNLSGDKRLSTTLHETQHAMQRQEGRPGGASKEYWAAQGAEDPKAMYRNTAGEIEARETQKRMNMTAEERRETMPDLGWDRAVFAESNEKLSDKALSSYERAYEMVYGKKPEPKDVQEAEEVRAKTMDRGSYQQSLDAWMVRYEQAKEDGSIDQPEVQARLNEEMDALDQAWEQIQEAETKTKTSAAGAIAKRYLKNYNSSASREAITGEVEELYRSLQRAGGSARWLQNSQAIRKAEAIAEQIVDKAVVTNDAMYRDYENLRKHLRETKLVVSPEVKAEITDYGDFRKRNVGRLNLTSGEQTNVDQVFQELAEDWPGLFNEMDVTNPGDQLQAIADVMEDVYTITEEPAYQNPEYREQAVKDMAASIMKTVWVRRGKLAADQIDQSFATIPTPEKKAKGLPVAKEVTERDAETVPDDDYMNSLLEEAEREENARNREAIEKAAELVSARVEPEKKTLKETGKEIGGFIYRKFVDSGAEIQKAGKQSGDEALYAYYNQAKAATAAAQNMIGMEQTNIYGRRVGESLADIFRPIKEQGDDYYNAFQSYLLHMHNIDRMGTDADKARLDAVSNELDRFDATHEEISDLTERELYELAASGDKDAQERLALVNQKNQASNRIKPVFGYEVTAKDSQAETNRLVGLHPEFRELAKKVYGYSRNLMQYRIDSGLISQELADKFQEIYPHYVPTFRKQDGEANQKLSQNVRIGKGVKRATGGNDALVPLDVALGSQTMSTVREGSKNRFGRRLLNDSISKDFILETKSEAAQNFDQDWEQIWEGSKLETENTFTVYEDGKAYAITMTPEMFEAVLSLTPEGKYDNLLPVRATRNANNLYKKLITAYNPTFILKNAAKDFQDSLLYSRDPGAWFANYPKAWAEITRGGKYWKQYKALGGTSSTVYDSIQGIKREQDDGFHWMLDKTEAINLAIEQAPRLAEFMAVVKKNGEDLDSLQEAMLAAADVTTNFGRSGKYGKFLNANFVPFLNPSIQGFDKLVRTITDPVRDRSIKAGVMLAARAAALGIAPAVLNYLWVGDEEDYDKIRNSDKNLNFLIPLGDGKWVKIPRGRVLSVFASMAHGGVRAAKGEKLDILDTWETFQEQVAPINPLDSNILKPWMDADLLDPDSPGKTWYGTDLESQRLQGYRESERYDESTDRFSKWVGKVTGKSPKKINYLIDSYTGVVGDVALPLLTPTKTTGRNPLTKPFQLDSVTSNKLSEEFYDVTDELQYDTNDGDDAAAITRKWWSKVSSDISELNAQIRKKENSTALDTKKKRDQIRALKGQVNDLMEGALQDMEKFRETAGKYTDLPDDEAFEKTAREMFGAEEAVRLMGDDEYDRAWKAHQEGATYEDYLDYKDLMRRLDAIYKAEKALTSEDVEGMSETQYRTIAQQRVDKLHEEEAELIQTYSEGDTGWKTLKKHHQLAVLESMKLPEEEAVALWYSRILYSDENRKEADMLEFKGLPKNLQYQYYQQTKFANGYEDSKKPGRTKSGSRQDQIIPIIKSMDLTKEQRRIIWVDIENWSANTLYKVM